MADRSNKKRVLPTETSGESSIEKEVLEIEENVVNKKVAKKDFALSSLLNEDQNPDTGADVSSEKSENDDTDELENDQVLFSETKKTDKEKSQKKKFGMLKRQRIFIISFMSLSAVLLICYFAWIRPLVTERSTPDPVIPPELADGEAYDTDGYSLLMFPYIAKEDIQTIEVSNLFSKYKVYVSVYDDQFYIDGYEQVPIGADALSLLVVNTGYALVSERITTNCDDFAKYGLGENDNPSWYRITADDGSDHVVYIGNMIPSGGGYYARYKNRDALYILSYDVGDSLLTPMETIIYPMVGYQLDSNSYATMSEFALIKNGQTFLYIKYNENTSGKATVSTHSMIIPTNYIVKDENYSEVVLYSLSALTGASVVKAGKITDSLLNDAKLMEEYGFFDIENRPIDLYYSVGDMACIISFAPTGVDGYYYAYSHLYNMIVLIETETVKYLEWDILNYVYEGVYAQSILEVSNITISGTYKSQNKTHIVNESFDLGVYDTAVGGVDVKVYAHSTDKTLNTEQVGYFKKFYLDLLRIGIGGHIGTEGVDVSDPDNNSSLTYIGELTITMNDGTVFEYKFYRYHDLRCFFTVSGSGEFYSLTQQVYKSLSDAFRIANGLSVDADELYDWLYRD